MGREKEIEGRVRDRKREIGRKREGGEEEIARGRER